MNVPNVVQKQLNNGKWFPDMFYKYLKGQGIEIDNDKTLQGVAYFDARAIGGLTTQRFFVGNAVPGAAQNTNLDTFVRPQTEHAVLWGLRISDVVNVADVRAVDWVAGANDASLKNATISVTINSEVVLRNYPLREALDNLTTRDNGYIPLPILWTWPGQTSLEIVLTPATGQTFTANLNTMIELLGVGLQ